MPVTLYFTLFLYSTAPYKRSVNNILNIKDELLHFSTINLTTPGIFSVMLKL